MPGRWRASSGRSCGCGVEVAFNRFVDLLADPEPDTAGSRAHLRRPRPRRVPRRAAASTRCSPPTASARGSPGGASSRPASPAASRRTRSTRSARRSSPTSTSSRPSRPRATRRSSPSPRARASAAGGGSCGCSRRTRPPARRRSARPPPPRRGRCRAAASPRSWPGPAPTAQPGEAHLDSLAARLARRLGEGAIGAEAVGAAVVFVPDPDAPGRRRRLEAAVQRPRRRARPDGGVDRARWRSRAARVATHRLAAAGRLGDGAADGLVVADEHLADLLLAADPARRRRPRRVPARAARRRSPTARARGCARRSRRGSTAPARSRRWPPRSSVHPQTVRYRVRQLRDLFGDRLEDPDARFELSLALRVR